MIGAIIDILVSLIKNMSVIIVLAYVVTRTRGFSVIMKKERLTARQQIF